MTLAILSAQIICLTKSMMDRLIAHFETNYVLFFFKFWDLIANTEEIRSCCDLQMTIFVETLFLDAKIKNKLNIVEIGQFLKKYFKNCPLEKISQSEGFYRLLVDVLLVELKEVGINHDVLNETLECLKELLELIIRHFQKFGKLNQFWSIFDRKVEVLDVIASIHGQLDDSDKINANSIMSILKSI